MKKINYILLLLCCMFSPQPYFAQLPVVIEGELARIEYGTDVIIQGDYTHRDLYDAIGDTTYAYTFWNFSKLYITGDITNESELTDVFEPMLLKDFRTEGFDLAGDLERLEDLGIDISTATTQAQQYALLDEFYNNLGKVILNHPTDSQYVKGKVYMANLDIIKNDGDKVIVQDGSLQIENKLHLFQGELQLNNSVLELGDISSSNGDNNHIGLIENEGHEHYVTMDNKSYMITRRLLSAEENNDFGNIGISFAPSREANYTIYRWQTPLNAAGDGSIARYYRIATDNMSQPTHFKDIQLHFLEHETENFPKDELAVWYSDDNGTNFRNAYHASLTLNDGGNQQHIVHSDSVHLSRRRKNTNILTIGKYACDEDIAVSIGDRVQYLCGSDDSLYLHPQASLSGMEYAWEKLESPMLLLEEDDDSLLVKEEGKYALLLTNNKGCKGYDTIEVKRVEKPIANFEVSNPLNQLSLGDSFVYVNHSYDPNALDAGLPLTYEWHFLDPFFDTDTSYAQDTSYAYQKTGIYQTALEVSNTYGCVAQDTSDKLFVYPVPSVRFDVPPICVGVSAEIENLSTLTPTRVVDYTASGSQFSVGLVSSKRKWTIYDKDSLAIDVIDNTQDLSYTFPDTGKYYIGLTESNSIGHEVTKVVETKAYEIPVLDFEATEACAGNAVTLSVINQSDYPTAALQLTWDIQEVAAPLRGLAPSWIPQFEGEKLVKVNAKVGACTYEYSKYITVKPRPAPLFVTDGAFCFGEEIAFTNLTTYGEGEEPADVSYTWDMGDGTVIQSKEATHSFTAPTDVLVNRKTFPIRLTASTSLCSVSLDTSFTLSRSPSALFDLKDDIICVGTNAIVEATGTFAPEDGLVWDFGDGKGKIYDETAVNKVFEEAGTYTITLKTYTDKSCDTNTFTQTLVVEDLPSIDVPDYVSVCGDTITLDVTSTQEGMLYEWSTGEDSPKKLVEAEGYYQVNLTSAQGCKQSKGIQVNLSESGSRLITQTVDSCRQAKLTSSVVGADYLWSTGETTQSIVANATGTYTVVASVPGSCEITTQFELTIHDYPDLSVIPDLQTACEAEGNIVFDAQNDGATSFLWKNLSTGESSEDALMSVTTAGIHDYNIRIINDGMCSLNKNVRAEMYPQPTLDLGEDQNICDEGIILAEGNFSQYQWSSGETTPYITVSTAGTYSVEVTDSRGCTVSDELEIFTPNKPEVDLGADQYVCLGTEVILDAQNVGSSYIWSTGETTQQITVNSTGDYYVNVKSTEGCIGRDTVHIKVADPINVNLGQDRFICSEGNQILQTDYAGYQHQWGSLGGLSATTEQVTVDQTDTYWVTVTNDIGCQGSDTVSLTYTDIPLVANFTSSSQANLGDIIQFVNLSYENIKAQEWNFGDNSTSEEENPRHRFTAEGTFTIQLVVDNGLCTDSYSKAISILPEVSTTATTDTASSTNGRYETVVEIKKAIVFPNPTQQTFVLEVELSSEATISANLMNLSGKVLQQHQEYTQLYEQSFDLSNVESGTYVMQVIVGGQQLRSIRVIKD